VLGLLKVLLATLRALFRSRRELMLENAVLRHQLEVTLRTRPRPRLTAADRVALVCLSRIWPDGWRRHLRIVKPETVIGWHRRGWRLYWTWRSKARIGRPRLSTEVRELIAEMAEANPLWGTEHIRGELLKLGIIVSNRSIRRYRTRPRSPTGSQHWRTFLTNELRGIWAADFFVVQTLNMRTPYVFVMIAHARRELVSVTVTDSPTSAWIWQQFVEATPWGVQPLHLIHDHDAVYGKVFPAQLERTGVTSVRTPIRAPRANAVAERAIRTLREECLDHVIVLNEHQLRKILAKFVAYYNEERPHRTLGLDTPRQKRRKNLGPIVRKPVLGGLHHTYARAA
jgi:transposase InsO family protein